MTLREETERAIDAVWSSVANHAIALHLGEEPEGDPNDEVRALRAAIEAELADLRAEVARLRQDAELLDRWRAAHRESVVAYQAWGRACDAPGKPGAITARLRLQEAMKAVTKIEAALDAARQEGRTDG